MRDVTEAKTTLKSVMKAETNVKLLEDKIQVISAILEGGAIQYGDKVQSSNNNGRNDLQCRLVDLKNTLNKQKMDRINKLILVQEVIGEIEENVYAALLQARYIQCMSWADVSVMMGYSQQHLHRLHGQALVEFQEKLEIKSNKNKAPCN